MSRARSDRTRWSSWPASPGIRSRSTIRATSIATTPSTRSCSIFWLVQSLLVEPADWSRIAYESLVDAAAHGLRYREMFFTPARHLAAGQDLASIVDGLTEGIEAAETDTGVRCRLIADIDRAYGPAAGLELVEVLAGLRRSGRAERVIAVGADSTELGVDLRTFAPAFESARRHGFRRTSHAGEAVGCGPTTSPSRSTSSASSGSTTASPSSKTRRCSAASPLSGSP